MVSVLTIKPNRKIWIEGDYSLSDGVKSVTDSTLLMKRANVNLTLHSRAEAAP